MRFLVYQSADGWRWHLLAANGRIVADSGEAYSRERDAVRAVKRIKLEVYRAVTEAR